MSELTREELEAIHERADGFCGFEGVAHHRRGLVELDEDGKWLYWDMNTPFSENALDFVRHAQDDVLKLLLALAEAQARNAALEQLVREAYEDVPNAWMTDGYGDRALSYDWLERAAKLLNESER